MKTSLLVFLVLMIAQTTEACICLHPPPPAEALKKADAVFVGYVVSGHVLSEEWGRKFVFKVMEVIKGDFKEEETVVVSTGKGMGDCGWDFVIGRAYLVYAYGDNELGTNICSRTMLFSYSNTKHMKELEELRASSKTP